MESLPFDIKQTRQMILFIGIQASGKTSFYQRVLAEYGYAHINLDTLHTRHNEQLAILNCFRHGTSFVVDNTNPTKSDRARYIVEAKQSGYKIIGIFFSKYSKGLHCTK